MNARGVVISVHALGATVRLEDGHLAGVPAEEVAKHRPVLIAALSRREPLDFNLRRRGRHFIASLGSRPSDALPLLGRDEGFESMMNAYLKTLEDREPPDRPAPAERHFIRKKRRATIFESRHREI